MTLLQTCPDWDTLAHHENDKETHRPSEADAGCSLADAEANIRRRLRAARPVPEGEHYGAEWRAVEQWCEERGLILPAHVTPERTGGREHDLTRLADGRVWWKFTKPWASGYAVDLMDCEPTLRPARPLQYLARLKLQNRYFGDAIRFVGITHDAKSRRLVISQPDIQGRPASWEEIDQWFESQGFSKLKVHRLGAYDSVAFGGHGVGIFDVRPINVVMTDNGTLLPIDVIMRPLTRLQLMRLIPP